MTLTYHDLPPPVIFTHEETLHSISLPPLAEFLTSLSTPDRILKLYDILQRFRTPKSYHRVDVRYLESSDLPPGSPNVPRKAEHTFKGETQVDGSTELPVGLITAEEPDDGHRRSSRRATHSALQPQHYVAESKTEAGPSRRSRRLTEKEARERGHPVVLPPGMSKADYLLGGLSSPPNGDANHDANPEDLAPNGTGDQDERTPSPAPDFTLPPSGPLRRVRELRLDLRTLDAAALFSLETWRREVLGLVKLSLEHPDSVWYEEPPDEPPESPEPSPIPTSKGSKARDSTTPVQSSPKKRGRGRPRKYPRIPSEANLSTSEQTGLVAQEEVQQASREESDTENNDNGVIEDETLVAALAAVDAQEDVSRLEEFQTAATAAGTETAADEERVLESTSEDYREPVDEAKGLREVEIVAAGVSPDEVIEVVEERSPSPDVVLHDGFDRQEDQDPDFVPSTHLERGLQTTPTKRRRKRAQNPHLSDAENVFAQNGFDFEEVDSVPATNMNVPPAEMRTMASLSRLDEQVSQAIDDIGDQGVMEWEHEATKRDESVEFVDANGSTDQQTPHALFDDPFFSPKMVKKRKRHDMMEALDMSTLISSVQPLWTPTQDLPSIPHFHPSLPLNPSPPADMSQETLVALHRTSASPSISDRPASSSKRMRLDGIVLSRRGSKKTSTRLSGTNRSPTKVDISTKKVRFSEHTIHVQGEDVDVDVDVDRECEEEWGEFRGL